MASKIQDSESKAIEKMVTDLINQNNKSVAKQLDELGLLDTKKMNKIIESLPPEKRTELSRLLTKLKEDIIKFNKQSRLEGHAVHAKDFNKNGKKNSITEIDDKHINNINKLKKDPAYKLTIPTKK